MSVCVVCLQVILNSLWLGYNVTEALDQPRYHHQLLPDVILHEVSWPLVGLYIYIYIYISLSHSLCLSAHKLVRRYFGIYPE